MNLDILRHFSILSENKYILNNLFISVTTNILLGLNWTLSPITHTSKCMYFQPPPPHTDTHKHTQTHIHRYRHTQVHIQTHTHTHTHAHTLTHTHAPVIGQTKYSHYVRYMKYFIDNIKETEKQQSWRKFMNYAMRT